MVGNEDGAHHTSAEILQAHDDGFALAATTVHLARLLAREEYPAS